MNRQWLVSIAIPLGMALNIASVHAQSPLGTLHGVTVKADGAPVAEAQVVIHRDDDNSDLTVTSGSDGAFAVSNLKPGRYAVKASKGEFQSPAATVDLAAQQDLKVDLSLADAAAADISPAVAKKLEAMMARIEQLEA
jgi:adhesin/invasin